MKKINAGNVNTQTFIDISDIVVKIWKTKVQITPELNELYAFKKRKTYLNREIISILFIAFYLSN